MFIPFSNRLKVKIDSVFEQVESEVRKIVKTDEEIKQFIVLKLAQSNLLLFTMLTHGRYQVSWAHELLAKKLEKVEQGKLKRLMVIAPPRFGKSWMSSVTFPIYYMARNDRHKVMAVSHNASLVNDFGRHARNMTLSEVYYNIWAVDKEVKDMPLLSRDSKAISNFSLTNLSEYAGLGIKSGGSGKGGHVILIDDWIRSYEDLTTNKLEKDWEYYNSTLYNRQERCDEKGEAAFVVVQTHWHKKDLIGKLKEAMQEKEGDQWEIFHLPAEAIKNEFFSKDEFYYYT